MKDMQTAIESAFEQRNDLSQVVNSELHDAVNEAIIQLDSGMLRVAEPIDDQWVVCEWLKKAVLLSFVLHSNEVRSVGCLRMVKKGRPAVFCIAQQRGYRRGGHSLF